jgi:hypothetical protein
LLPATASSSRSRVLTGSAPRPGPAARGGLYATVALLAGGATFVWALLRHRVLLYGDAAAHLGIARRIVDSATPGPSQLGTVWLPLPHLLMAPFAASMALWRTGAAGAIPSLLAFALATGLLHRSARRAWGAGAAAWAALAFALNPALLYLAAVPMTETIYLAVFLGLVDQCAAAAAATDEGARRRHAWGAGAWGLAGSLCRYDGWFVLPFALAALVAGRGGVRRAWTDARGAWSTAWRFCLLSGLGPVFWFGYNLYYFKDPLAFARGPGSARQIYLDALRHGGARYPGDHALGVAALYFSKAVELALGQPLLILAGLGLLAWRRWVRQPAAWLLLLPLPWYLWAMWTGNVPIFVPQYWPHGYYNLRYGVQMLPAAAVFSGIVAGGLTRAARRVLVRGLAPGVAIGLALLVGAAYAGMLRPPGPSTYAEAVHNAPARLAMQHALAAALAGRRPGERVLLYYGSYPEALAADGIPLHDAIQESNYRLWRAALAAPQRYVTWIAAEAGTPVATQVPAAALRRYFHPVARLRVAGEPDIEVYRRNGS